MPLKKQYYTFLTVAAILCSACTPPVNKSLPPSPRYYIQPVYLTVNGIEKDTAIYRYFREAFSARKVKLISADEMRILNEKEAKREGEKVFTKDAKFDSPEAMQRALGREHRYVSNMLSVSLVLEERDDSLVIYQASWSSIPFPPNFNRPYISRSRTINMTSMPYTLRDNIFSIADSILHSGELK